MCDLLPGPRYPLLRGVHYKAINNRAEVNPAVTADLGSLKESKAGPDGKDYKVWEVGKGAKGIEPGTYLVDETGRARHRVEVGSLFDLSKRLPKSWNDSPAPSLVAFGLMTLVLVLTGLGLVFRDREPPGVVEGITARVED